MNRKSGTIINWGTRGFGIIRVGPESSLERYFLHVSKIRSGTATPAVGMEVIFDVSSKPVEDGRLPQAVRADIILPEEMLDPDQFAEPKQDGKDGGQ